MTENEVILTIFVQSAAFNTSETPKRLFKHAKECADQLLMTGLIEPSPSNQEVKDADKKT